MHLSPSPERFGVISGRSFLHCKKGTKADLNTAPRKVAAFAAPKTCEQMMIRPTWLKLGRPLGWADGRTVYNHSSGVAAQSRELPSNGPQAALCYHIIALIVLPFLLSALSVGLEIKPNIDRSLAR